MRVHRGTILCRNQIWVRKVDTGRVITRWLFYRDNSPRREIRTMIFYFRINILNVVK